MLFYLFCICHRIYFQSIYTFMHLQYMFWNYIKAFTEKGATFWGKVYVTQIVSSKHDLHWPRWTISCRIWTIKWNSVITIHFCSNIGNMDKTCWTVFHIMISLLIPLSQVGVLLKAFLPQLQTTFLRALSDPNRAVRLEAALALAKLVVIHTRVDPLFTELHNGIKNTEADIGIR